MRKFLILFLFLFLASPVFAADTKVINETAISSVAGGDVVYCVDDPSGTPLDRKCTFTQVQTFVLTGEAATATALAADGGNCAAGSYPLGVDASGAVQSCTDASTEIDSIIASDFPAIIAENGAEEMFGETMGTACAEDEILKTNASGGLDCAATFLDFYEEGTFTPVLKFGGGVTGITYSTQVGSYTKIGNIVNWSLWIGLSNKGSDTGTATITGLPFSARSGTFSFEAPCYLNGISSIEGSVIAEVIASTTLNLWEVTAAGTTTSLVDTNFGNGSIIRITGHYETTP